MIIFAFPGTGKSSLARKYQQIIDLELSDIKYDNRQVSHLSKEERKSLKRPLKDKHYKKTYVDKALGLHGQGKIVLVALNFLPRILWELKKRKDSFYHVFVPHAGLKEDYLDRYRKRGNNQKFIWEMKLIWYPTTYFFALCKKILPHRLTILQQEEVLEDYLEEIERQHNLYVNVLNNDKFLKKI